MQLALREHFHPIPLDVESADLLGRDVELHFREHAADLGFVGDPGRQAVHQLVAKSSGDGVGPVRQEHDPATRRDGYFPVAPPPYAGGRAEEGALAGPVRPGDE